MILFSETVDAAICTLMEKMSGFPVGVWTREFLDGYRAYIQKESTDPYYLVLPKNAPQRLLKQIDDGQMRGQLDGIFKAMQNVIQSIVLSHMSIDRSISQIWRQLPWPADFSDTAYSDSFHFAVKCILEYEKFRYADTIEKGINIPEELQGLYDKDERLINVTTATPLREAFVMTGSDLAIIPTYKSDYGLKEKFALLFSKGIPKKWNVWVSPSEIISREMVPTTFLIQEERQWGAKFDEDAFKRIFTKVYGEFQYVDNKLPDRLMRIPLYKLQYTIESNDKEDKSSAIIEELIDITYGQSMIDPYVFVCGSSGHYYVRHRMIHLMYDQKRSTFVHIDLSYLYYNESDYYKRLDQTLGQTKPHATKKQKVFKIDGDIPFAIISDLIGTSLDGIHNPEVRKLLNGE